MGIIGLEIDPQYVESVVGLVCENPTSSNFDRLLEAYATLGFYEAQLSQRADDIEAVRKNTEANTVISKKMENPKYTAAELDAYSTVATFDIRRKEIQARGDWRKMSNLRFSVEQAINGIKWLGRLA
jgi:hypothetical protein